MILLCILSQLRCKLVFLYPELQDIDWIDSQLNDSHWFGHWADWKLSSEAEVALSSIHVYIKGLSLFISQFSFELNIELGPDHVTQWLSTFLAHVRDLGSFSK